MRRLRAVAIDVLDADHDGMRPVGGSWRLARPWSTRVLHHDGAFPDSQLDPVVGDPQSHSESKRAA